MTLIKDYKFIFLVALAMLLRLAIMVTTYHPDLRAAEFAGYAILEMGKGIGFYDVLPRLSPTNPLYQSLGPSELNYPPLAWFTPTLFRLVLRPFLNPQVDYAILTHVDRLFGTPQLMWQLFFLKIPLLTADLITAWLLTFLFSQREKKKLIFLIWLFNPLTLYATFAMGQIDIWPVLTTVLAGVLLTREKPTLAAFVLGLGGGYKIFPLLMLLPTALLFGKNFKEKAKLLAIGFGTYLLIILPFVLTSPGYRAYSLLTPQTDKMLFAKVMVSGDQYLSLFVIAYIAILFLCTRAQRQNWMLFSTGIFLVLFSVTHYHPQWFLWLTPWLAFYWVKESGTRWLMLALLMADIGITLSFDSSLHYGLFAPILTWIANVPYALPAIISRFMPFPEFVSLIRSFLAGSALAFGIYLFNHRLDLKV